MMKARKIKMGEILFDVSLIIAFVAVVLYWYELNRRD